LSPPAPNPLSNFSWPQRYIETMEQKTRARKTVAGEIGGKGLIGLPLGSPRGPGKYAPLEIFPGPLGTPCVSWSASGASSLAAMASCKSPFTFSGVTKQDVSTSPLLTLANYTFMESNSSSNKHG
jgi:hypothetical protein